MSPAGDVLVVTADLDVHVVAPDGRTARVRLSDEDGTLVVDVQEVRVLLSGLPRGAGAAVRPLARTALDVLARVRSATGATWEQPVQLRLDGRAVLSRDGGRWRPGPAVRRPAVTALAVLAGVLVVVVGVLVAARKRRPTG